MTARTASVGMRPQLGKFPGRYFLDPGPSQVSHGAARGSPLEPRPHHSLDRRNFAFRFETNEFRNWLTDEALRRARVGMLTAGASHVGHVGPLPTKTRRWCVLRSPHVDKKSREHFWLKTKVRLFRAEMDLSAERNNDNARHAAQKVASALPASVAVKVTECSSALLSLPEMWYYAHGGAGTADASISLSTSDATTPGTLTQESDSVQGDARESAGVPGDGQHSTVEEPSGDLETVADGKRDEKEEGAGERVVPAESESGLSPSESSASESSSDESSQSDDNGSGTDSDDDEVRSD